MKPTTTMHICKLFSKLSMPLIPKIKNYLKKIETSTLLSYGVYQVEADGLSLFESIKGDMNSIMGLPVKKIQEYLNELK